MEISELKIESPLGPLHLAASDAGLRRIAFDAPAKAGRDGRNAPSGARQAILERARRALARYFSGEPEPFDGIPLDPDGTDFQRRVWECLRTIPAGETRSYGDVARAIGRPRAVRAVGSANRVNPLPIVVPCHRVIGGDGALRGYAGRLDRKEWLLKHEGAMPEGESRESRVAGRKSGIARATPRNAGSFRSAASD
jgi:methylated-DNA-[protein]-cysteine S-methyltransferase